MKIYRIPGTDLTVSRLAYGCMRLGGSWGPEPITPEQMQAGHRALEAALDAGINFFDHADIYGRGKSELVFGELLHGNPGLRERIVIQSKCGIRFPDDPQPGAPVRYDFSYDHIVRAVEGSLRRLQTDYLDILLLHRPDALVEPEEVARAFDDLQAAGKVRHFGVSNHTAGQIALLSKYLRQAIVANQMQLSLVHHFLISEGLVANIASDATVLALGTLDYCRQHDIQIQAWGPVANGRLFKPEVEEALRPVADLVARLADEKGVSPDALMLAWLLRHPSGIHPIIGTTRPDRIAASAPAVDVELTREEWYALLAAARGRGVP
ncbi:MAG: Oxidoreductase YdhF [Chloroflexi bacterium ADurb.Bin325]|nr:MAG: Oxidoreductase YdhF [Chloroflexi bacterium ADurb.Bin325]